ncbi:Protein mahjong, partial [Pseudolycoriella hygida]
MAAQPAGSVNEREGVLQGTDLHAIFKLWEEKHSTPMFDPHLIITRLAEIFEEETEVYMRKDPDPFDERHPSRTDPDCELGRMLKLLFRKDHFMTRLVNDYLRDNFFTRQNIQKSSFDLNVAACRLILVIMPGLETSAVFQVEFDNLIHRLYSWAESSEEPLRSYATGLLAAAMEVQDIAIGFREQNAHLVTTMLKRLHTLQGEVLEAKQMNGEAISTPIKSEVKPTGQEPKPGETGTSSRPFAHLGGGSVPSSPELTSPTLNGLSKFKNTIHLNTLIQNDNTSQSQGESKYVRNTIPIYPPTTETNQMLILRYLTSMGEYQEFLGQVFEHNAMQIIFRYIENVDNKGTCIAFEALKYLASLLCHKKFSLEFINHGGLERLIRVTRPSIAATGVSIALYYLAYCEDAMERICSMSQKFVSEVVTYALWLLGCSHDSGRCHATMFFGLAFQFKIILDEFDNQDGLRKLYNVISVLPILGDEHNLNEDETCAARQLIRHVCVALKKYMESHLYYKYSQVSRLNTFATQGVTSGGQLSFRASKQTPEMISEQVRTLQELLHVRARWDPVEKILYLNVIPLLLRIIAYAYDWNHSCRGETVRAALEVLIICCAIPKVHLVFCDRINLPDDASAAGINIILGAAEGEIVADTEVQKAALAVLVHCVCSPIVKPVLVSRYGMGAAKKKIANKQSEEIIKKIWESVRSNNGIIVLLQLMEIKTPITDADCIRGMACRALAGLARSETVQQIIGKLPLFTNGQLQSLMRDPILQEKRTEHVQFQKYALELMELVSGKSKSSNQLDSSLANIHKANVVAQTRIQFNEQQLYELIHEHLRARGMQETAASLQREAGLTAKVVTNKSLTHHSPFSFRSPSTSIVRSRMRMKPSDFNAALNATESSPQISTKNDQNHDSPTNAPIKLIKKSNQFISKSNINVNMTPQQRSLQKQISSEYVDASPTTSRLSQMEQFSKNITLDTIITEYLTNQHALCKNPMSTCPQFDLFAPHKCPDPRPNKMHGLCSNFAGRYFRRQAGYNSKRLDRRLVHSQFCMARTIRSQDDTFFTCCDFTPCTTSVIVGLHSGEVKVFNNESGDEYSHPCHNSFVNNVTCSRDGTLLLTSSAWRQPLSSMWNIDKNQFSLKLHFDEEEYLEFSKLNEDKVLGTNGEMATIYDIRTGKSIVTLSPTIQNQYTKNRATFCPTDELILSDGVLWDVLSGKEIHKFDKLNQTLSGVFHPNGLEIVSNTEVWDLRTFHLLRTVPALDQSIVTFSPQNVIYGMSSETEPDSSGSSYDSRFKTFKTLDSYDYSSIATVDVKRNIYDLCVNKYGSQIAVVENVGSVDAVQESVVRLYSVGRRKNMDDDAEDDENDMPDSSDSSDTDTGVYTRRRVLCEDFNSIHTALYSTVLYM